MRSTPGLTLGAWMSVPSGHPLQDVARDELFAPNPEYASLMKSGRPMPEGLQEFDALYEESAHGMLYVPRAWAVSKLHVPSWIDRTVNAPVPFPPFKVKLREGQGEFVGKLMHAMSAWTGAIGQAAPGYGKTICGGSCMFGLQQRTLVSVHTDFLMQQWAERLEMCGLKSNQIGFVQQDRCEYGGKKLVTIAMIQTLLAREFEEEFYRAFGFMLFDEVHRMGAATFRQVITRFAPSARLGLSATPDRKDGCEFVFKAHIGEVAAIGKGAALAPKVWSVRVAHYLPDDAYQSELQSRRMDHFQHRMRYIDDLVKIETYLTQHGERNRVDREAAPAGGQEESKGVAPPSTSCTFGYTANDAHESTSNT